MDRERDKDFIFEWPDPDRNYDNYRDISEGDILTADGRVLMREVVPWTGDPKALAIDNVEFEIIEVDNWNSDQNYALVELTNDEEGEPLDEPVRYRLPFSKISAEVNWNFVGDDETEDWDSLMEWLTEDMQEKCGDGPYWLHFEGSNMGWTHASGYRDDKVDDGEAMIQRCLPKTNEYTVRAYHYDGEAQGPGYKIVVSHHDSMGDLYIITNHKYSPEVKDYQRDARKDFHYRYGKDLDEYLDDDDYIEYFLDGYTSIELADRIADDDYLKPILTPREFVEKHDDDLKALLLLAWTAIQDSNLYFVLRDHFPDMRLAEFEADLTAALRGETLEDMGDDGEE